MKFIIEQSNEDLKSHSGLALVGALLSELVQLKLDIGTSVGDSTPTEATFGNPHL